MATSISTALRDYVTDGVPASGANKPDKRELREALEPLESAIKSFTANGGLVFASKALLDASLDHDANAMAWVLGDSTVNNNGVYQKVDASGSGSWTRIADLPYTFVRATDAGAGTPNAIVATSTMPIFDGALVALDVYEVNTGAPVTVSFNGGAAKTVKTASGNDVATGGLTAGMALLGVVRGSLFRLLSDQSGSAIQVASEAAQQAAEDARDLAIAAADQAAVEGAGDVPTYPSRALAVAATIPTARTWLYVAGFASKGDGGHAHYRKVDSEPSHDAYFQSADGAYWEVSDEFLNPLALSDDPDISFQIAAEAICAGYYRALRPIGVFSFDSSTRIDFSGDAGGSPAPDGEIVVDGEGACTLVFDAGTNSRPFVFRNIDGLIVRGIHFKNENSAASTNCLDILNCTNVLVEENIFEGSTFYGVVVGEDVIGGTDAACDNVRIKGNTFKDIGCIGLEMFPKVKSQNAEVSGNWFFNCGYNPNSYVSTLAAMKPAQAYEHAKVFGNIIYVGDNAGAIGIACGAPEHWEVYDNQIFNARSIAIGCTLTDHPHPYVPGIRHVSIRDNLVAYMPDFTPTEAAIIVNGDRTDGGEIIIARNRVIRPYRGIMVEPAAALPKVSIFDNEIVEPVGTEPIYCSNANGGAPQRVRVEGNKVINRDLTKTGCRMYFLGCASPTVRGNDLVNFGNNAIIFESCTGDIVCDDNVIDGYNVANTSSVAAIGILDTSSSDTYYIRGNRVTKGQGNPKALVSANSANPKIICHENKLDAGVLVGLTSTPNFQVDMTRCVEQFGTVRVFYGTAAPSSGAYGVGDEVRNTAPTAGGNRGWICTAGGSPGTWKTFGTIAS